MESVRQTQKKYGSRAIWTAIILGLCFFLAGLKPVGKGVVLVLYAATANFAIAVSALDHV